MSAFFVECMLLSMVSERHGAFNGGKLWGNQSINHFTFYVFRTHQASQQTITGKTVYTKH